MTQPAISVSTAGFLKVQPLLYASPRALAGEMLQNAQRAGATEVKILVSHDGFSIRDNGTGCDDWAAILTLAESGWDDKSQNPFGLGFWSVSSIASKVQVRSGESRLEIDMNGIRTGKDPNSCIRIEDAPFLLGFQVAVECIDVKNAPLEFDDYDMRTAFREMAPFLDIEMTLCGETLEKFDGEKFLEFPWSQRVDLGADVLYIRPMPESYNWRNQSDAIPGTCDKIQLVYQDRPVCKTGVAFVWGALIAKRGLDLRAPDRTEVVQNKRWEKLQKEILAVRKNIFLNILRCGSNEDLDTYAEGIAKLVGTKDLTRHVRFKYMEPTISAREAAAEDMEADGVPEAPISSNASRRETRMAVTESLSQPLVPASDVVPEGPVVVEDTFTASQVSNAVEVALDTAPEPVEAPKHHGPVQRGGRKLGTARVYYVKEEDAKSYRVEQALKFGAEVVLIRNKVEGRLAKAAPNMVAISKVENCIETDISAEVMPPVGSRQKRALRLLRGLLSGMGFEGNVTMADVTSVDSLKGGVNTFTREEPLLVTKQGDTLYLDHALTVRLIGESGLQQDRASIGLPDISFLALCSPFLTECAKREFSEEQRDRNPAELVMHHISRLVASKPCS